MIPVKESKKFPVYRVVYFDKTTLKVINGRVTSNIKVAQDELNELTRRGITAGIDSFLVHLDEEE